MLTTVFGLFVLSQQAGHTTRDPLPGMQPLAQVGTFGALKGGQDDGIFPVGQLLKYGDFGLGTFDRLDGEMIVLDGKIYRAGTNGHAELATPEAKTPFACVVPFRGEIVLKVGAMTSDDVKKRIDAAIRPNLILAVRIDGTFSRLTTRAFPPQKKPYRPLAAISAQEVRTTYPKIEGALVGFRMPDNIGDLNVPGYHFHFLSKDRKFGGNVLSCAVESATITIMLVRRIVNAGK